MAFEVFVENGNLSDAYEIADQAVQHVSHSLVWRRRLAQVAEWVGRPRIALAQWRFMARKDPHREAFVHILRLAPGTYEDEALVWALQSLAKQGWLAKEQRPQLAEAYERVGRPDQAIADLMHMNQESPDSALLEHVALLYERMGQGDAALALYDQLEYTYGPTLPWAITKATLHYRQGEMRRAYKVLVDVKSLAAESHVEFWKLFGQLAWSLEEDEPAEQAYQILWKEKKITQEEHARLLRLVQKTNPSKAIDIGLAGWSMYQDPNFLIMALDLLVQQKKWGQLQSTLEQIDPRENDLLARNPRYWIFRAEAMWKLQNNQETLRSYRRALALNPSSSEIRSAFLWYLIDQRHLSAVETYLKAWADEIEHDSQLWDAVAAAYQLLDQPEASLQYFQRGLVEHQKDYLWLLNYAQVLEASSQHDLAWKVRRQVWTTVRKELLATRLPAISGQTVQAYVELAIEKEPSHQFLQWVRTIEHRRSHPVIKELILSWFLSTESFEAARIWLWEHYAKNLDRPAWASLAIALEDNDWVAIDTLLVAHDDNLITQDKIVAANHLKRFPLAQSLAFDALTNQPNRDALDSRFLDATIPQADHVDSRLTFVWRSPLSSYNVKTSLTFNLGRISIEPAILVKWQSSTNSGDLVGVPRVDKRVGATLGLDLPKGRLGFSGTYRHAVSRFAAFKLQYNRIWNNNVTTSLELGRNQESNDSVALLVGGMEDVIKAQGTYRFSKRQFFELQVDVPWFFSQNRDKLGSGVGTEWVIGHRFRTEYPDLTVRVTGQVERYSRVQTLPPSMLRLIPGNLVPSVDLVVPNDFEQFGAMISLGESIRDTYTRGFRPFGSIGVNYNSTSGIGHSVEGGIATSLFGHDRLSLIGSYAEGGFGRNTSIRQFSPQYQLWF